MRSRWTFAGYLCCLALLLCGLGLLVDLPDPDTAVSSAPLPEIRLSLSVLPAPQAEKAEKSDPGLRSYAALLPVEKAESFRAAPADRNGVPLREKRYVLCAYQAFPPERMPG